MTGENVEFRGRCLELPSWGLGRDGAFRAPRRTGILREFLHHPNLAVARKAWLADLAVNQPWPGYVAGEWHADPRVCPGGARSGFLPCQLDLAGQPIRPMHGLGAVPCSRDLREDFLRARHAPCVRAAAVRTTG